MGDLLPSGRIYCTKLLLIGDDMTTIKDLITYMNKREKECIAASKKFDKKRATLFEGMAHGFWEAGKVLEDYQRKRNRK